MAQPKSGRGAARALGLLMGLLLPVGVLLYLGGTRYIAWSEHSLMASRFRVLAGFAAYLTEIADANRQAFAQTGVCPPPNGMLTLFCSKRDAKHEQSDAMWVVEPKGTGQLRSCVNETCGRLKIGELVKGLPRDDFDALLLVAGDGQVLHQEALPAIAVDNIRNPPRALAASWSQATRGGCESIGADDGEKASGGARPEASTSGPGGQSDGAASGSISNRLSAWGAERVCLAGEPYLLFCEPLRVDVTPPGKAAGLKLCGLVADSRFGAEARQIAWEWALPLFLVFVLALLALPLVTLWSLSPRERLRAIDVKVLVLAVLMGAGIVTLGIGAFRFRSVLGRQADRRLEHLARGTSALLQADVASVSNLTEQMDREQIDPGVAITKLKPPAGIHDASFINMNGYVERHWNFSSNGQSVETSPKSPQLSDRPYFEDAKSGRGWRRGSPVALQVVHSRLDGNLLLVAARKVRNTIVAVSTTMPNLNSLALTKFEGFALVDRNSSVLWHWGAPRSLQDSLTVESNGAPTLTATLWHHLGGKFDVLYHGRDHRIQIYPIKGSDWSIVSFLDMQEISAAAAEQVAGAGGLFAIYAALFVLAALLVHVVDRYYRAEWLWPDRQPARIHRFSGAAACLLLTAAVVPHALSGAPAWRAIQLMCLPVAAIGLLCLTLRDADAGRGEAVLSIGAALLGGSGMLAGCFAEPARPVFDCFCLLATGGLWATRMVAAERMRRLADALAAVVVVAVAAAAFQLGHWDIALAALITVPVWIVGMIRGTQAPRTELGFRVSYVSMLLALVLAVVVVPARVFVDDASAHVRSEMGRLDAWNLQGGRKAIEGDRQQREIKPRPFPEAERALIESGLLSAKLFDYLPLSSDQAAELRAMAGGWQDGADHQAADLTPGYSWLGLLALLALGAGGVVLWLLSRRIFLLDLDDLRTACRQELQHAPGSLGIWVYDHTGDAVRRRVNDDPVAPLDARLELDREELERWAREHANGDHLVEIDHLDACLENSERSAALLSLIASLAARRGKPLLLTSSLDPVEHLAARVAEGGGEEPAQQDRLVQLQQRWADVLGDFLATRHDIPAVGQDPSFARILMQEYPDVRVALGPTQDVASLETCHRKVWVQCTVPQRLVLRQLADEGFVNPTAASVVRVLMRRGLIRRDGALQLASPAFRDFVRRAESEETVARWEREEGTSDWSRLRAPLAIILLIGLGFFMYTQPDLSKSALAAATGLAAALPLALRLFGMTKEDGK